MRPLQARSGAGTASSAARSVYPEARHRTPAVGQLRAAQLHRVNRVLRTVKLRALGGGDVAHRPRPAVEPKSTASPREVYAGTSSHPPAPLQKSGLRSRRLEIDQPLRPSLLDRQGLGDEPPPGSRHRDSESAYARNAADFDVLVASLQADNTRTVRLTLVFVAGAVGCLLLIACMNIPTLWLLWNDPLSTLMRSSTPVSPERRAPSAISPRVGRRNDERSKGASTTSHAAIR